MAPATPPTTPPAPSRLALRSGLRCAVEAKPRTECRAVAFAAFVPNVLPVLAMSVSSDSSCLQLPGEPPLNTASGYAAARKR
jgi:hypothetical protein